VLLLLATVFALTAEFDRAPAHPPARPGLLIALLAGMPLLEMGARSVLPPTAWSELGIYLVLAGATLRYARSAGWPVSYLGLHARQYSRALLAGLVVGTAMVLGAALALPQGFQAMEPARLLGVSVWSLLVAGVLPEVYYRGLVHNALERYAGGPAAIVITAYLAAMPRAFPMLFTAAPFGAIQWIEVAVTSPAAFLVAGYLYHRTRNLFGSAALLGLLALLPQIVRF
jgi:hypothetical protein